MSQDYFGNPTETHREDTQRAISDFVADFLAYRPAAERILKAADDDAQSGLANALAGILLMFIESPEGPKLAARYQLRAAQATERDQRRSSLYLQLLDAWILDDLEQVATLSETLLDEFPRDLFALKINQYFHFNRGDWPAMLRVALKGVAHAADISHTHAMLAFAYEQCHLLEQAENAARHSLSLQADEPWAQHAVAHVLLTTGRINEGTAFLQQASAGWEGLNSFMYTHNWWHLALFHLARGRDQTVLDIYDRHVWGIIPEYSQDQIGAVSLLARLELAGVDVGPRWQALGKYLLVRVDDTVQSFLSLQYLYGLARAGHLAEAEQLLDALTRHAAQVPEFTRGVWNEITLPVAQGLLAHARNDYASAARLLGSALPRLNEIGGSHAQRDLFALIELDARLRSGDWLAVQQILELRRRHDPMDVPTNRSLAEVYQQLGLPDEARRAEERVAEVLARR